jgi:hypothetical protein
MGKRRRKGNNAANAPFRIMTDEVDQVVRVDQTTTAWQTLGQFPVTNGNVTVEMSNDANGNVIADAVSIALLSPLVPMLSIDDASTRKSSVCLAGVRPR